MLIAKYESNYGEEFWAHGEDVGEIVKTVQENTGESLNCDDMDWFRAMPVRVIGKTTYTVDNM